MFPLKLFFEYALNIRVNAMNGRLYLTSSTHSTPEKGRIFSYFLAVLRYFRQRISDLNTALGNLEFYSKHLFLSK
ncbi:hypothetical protein C7475_11219 [Chitinophaga sp. S165]|nr:hypothetical protein C7475_11219 [Chitinophaga sp. S165]